MGGATAAELVSRGLVHIDALVLEDPALLTPKQREDFRELGPSLVARCDEVTQNLGREIDLLLKDYPLWTPSEAAGWAQGKVQADREFLKRGVVGGARVREEILSALKVPTLLITGDGDDVLIGPAGAEAIDALENRNITTHVIPTARHCIRRSVPEPFYLAVNSFLEALKKN